MNDDPAKFVLGAYRPGSGDLGDPAFKGALAELEGNAALRVWFEKDQAFGKTVRAKLDR